MSDCKPFLIVSEGPSAYIANQCDTAEEAAECLMVGYRIYGLCSVHIYPRFDDHPEPPMALSDDVGRRAHMARLRGELAALEEMEAAGQAKADPDNEPEEIDEPAEESEVTE